MVIKVAYSWKHPVSPGSVEAFEFAPAPGLPLARASFAEVAQLPGTWAVVVERAVAQDVLARDLGELRPAWQQVAWLVPIPGCAGRGEYERELAGLVSHIEIDGEVWWNRVIASEHGAL